MPLTPIDYQKTIIYKIEHNVDKSLVYVGSTTDFKSRKGQHKSNCYNEKGKAYNRKLYVMIRENGGWEEYQMLEIKKYPCNDKREAEAEEERCRVELNANMNARRAFRSEEQILEDKKKYQEEHKEKHAEHMKKYYESNKDKIEEVNKVYRIANKDKKKEYDKKYHEKKRAIIKSSLIQ